MKTHKCPPWVEINHLNRIVLRLKQRGELIRAPSLSFPPSPSHFIVPLYSLCVHICILIACNFKGSLSQSQLSLSLSLSRTFEPPRPNCLESENKG